MPVDLTPAIKACLFKLTDGANCASPKLFARGYCEKHYRALRRANAFTDLTPKPRTSSEQVADNVKAVQRARRKLLKLAPTFIDHLETASKIASQKGDATPAQWAILHTRTIQPVMTSASGKSDGSGVVVNIGVKVSGTESK